MGQRAGDPQHDRPLRFRDRVRAPSGYHSPRSPPRNGPHYRDPEQVPEADWALPEKIAFIKPPLFAWQDEYRYAVGRRNALDFHNVEVTLTSGTAAAPVARVPPPIILQIGKLSDHVAVHRF